MKHLNRRQAAARRRLSFVMLCPKRSLAVDPAEKSLQLSPVFRQTGLGDQRLRIFLFRYAIPLQPGKLVMGAQICLRLKAIPYLYMQIFAHVQVIPRHGQRPGGIEIKGLLSKLICYVGVEIGCDPGSRAHAVKQNRGRIRKDTMYVFGRDARKRRAILRIDHRKETGGDVPGVQIEGVEIAV